jgi:hypothetical protein
VAPERKPKTVLTRRTQSITIDNLPTIDIVFETLSDQFEADRPIFLKKDLKLSKFGRETL